jgi:hypothetical protein
MTQETADTIADGIGRVEPFVSTINPLIPIGLGIVRDLIQAEPKLEKALRAIFAKTDLTAEDFDAAIEHILATTYEKLVPHSDLAKSSEAGALASGPARTP